jgi:transposase
MRPEARTILAAAPDPATAARLTGAQLRSLLRRAGRSRSIDAEAARLRDAFRAEQMRQPPLVEEAMGRQALALLRHLDAACASAEDLEQAAVESFNQHPDAGIITSFPGLGPLTGARVLAETCDDRSRFADAKGLKPYAGAAPVTRASGKTLAVLHRRVKNQRLAAAGYIWAFSAITASPGARAHYDRRKAAGDRTPPPSATSSGASSAASITAWPPGSPTTRPRPSPHQTRRHAELPLDNQTHRMSHHLPPTGRASRP